ncbi:MAG: AbrB/MazE/SpoVT family DNA-binding domain-containing protein [Syntrophaceae bacterium]|nr:AbrB/MazE/SpoVT family DNA-binding domain-containing protein [Syntrophaceae bacterium]
MFHGGPRDLEKALREAQVLLTSYGILRNDMDPLRRISLEEGLLLNPQKLISKALAWFWSKEWQEKEKEANESMAKGELSKPFEKADQLIGHLRKRR